MGVADPTPLSSGLFPAYEMATVLEGLEEDTRYEVFVVAFSLAGEGQLPTSVAAVSTFSRGELVSVVLPALNIIHLYCGDLIKPATCRFTTLMKGVLFELDTLHRLIKSYVLTAGAYLILRQLCCCMVTFIGSKVGSAYL